ncbi:MAG: ABC transporter ATP-binding protein [Chloroflexi bacterium]|nr:ABC transporter ATP-binding protein [Chloroflexota bacterium]
MLKVVSLHKAYVAEGRRVPALRGVSFDIGDGEFYTLLGPSGCGKSTTLRCVAGLEHPEEGEIQLGPNTVFSASRNVSMPAHQRDISMVFQSYAIWPHMNVFDNVAFPLVHGRERHSKAEVKTSVEEALASVHLEGLESRPASLLSGGQQQRVALARALVRRPALLLMDEPLSNLDARLRDEMRKEIKRLAQTFRLTTLYVTHDQVEALSLSDTIAVMHDGLIIQEGSPRDIYLSPRDGFVAGFVGRANLVKGTVVGRAEDRQEWLVETNFGRLRSVSAEAVKQGDEVMLSLRPEAISIYAHEPDARYNVLQSTIDVLTFTGENTECQVRVGDTLIEVKVHGLAKLAPGQKAYLHAPPEHCLMLPTK